MLLGLVVPGRRGSLLHLSVGQRVAEANIHGVHPAWLRFYTVAYCTPCRSVSANQGRGRRHDGFYAGCGVFHAMSTPEIKGRFMACNTALRLETWRAI